MDSGENGHKSKYTNSGGKKGRSGTPGNQNRKDHGLYALKKAWSQLGNRVIDGRSPAAVALRKWRNERFANKIERPSEFFHRIFQGQYATVVIPYRSVLAFYASELECHQASVGRHNVCACGCGQAVFDRKKWASPGCRQRAARRLAA